MLRLLPCVGWMDCEASERYNTGWLSSEQEAEGIQQFPHAIWPSLSRYVVAVSPTLSDWLRSDGCGLEDITCSNERVQNSVNNFE
jgi:hypothetical protein